MKANKLKNAAKSGGYLHRLVRWWVFLKMKWRLKRQRYVIGCDVSEPRSYGDDRIMAYACLMEAMSPGNSDDRSSLTIYDKRIKRFIKIDT